MSFKWTVRISKYEYLKYREYAMELHETMCYVYKFNMISKELKRTLKTIQSTWLKFAL